MTTERVFVSESRQSASVEPVKRDRPASPCWPKKRAKRMQPRITDGRKWPVVVRKIEVV